jgi:hypothetical protein
MNTEKRLSLWVQTHSCVTEIIQDTVLVSWKEEQIGEKMGRLSACAFLYVLCLFINKVLMMILFKRG